MSIFFGGYHHLWVIGQLLTWMHIQGPWQQYLIVDVPTWVASLSLSPSQHVRLTYGHKSALGFVPSLKMALENPLFIDVKTSSYRGFPSQAIYMIATQQLFCRSQQSFAAVSSHRWVDRHCALADADQFGILPFLGHLGFRLHRMLHRRWRPGLGAMNSI